MRLRIRIGCFTISIHASRVGGDQLGFEEAQIAMHFNPRLPGGRRRCTPRTAFSKPLFQSTPPGWEATESWPKIKAAGYISIHASRVGGDMS